MFHSADLDQFLLQYTLFIEPLSQIWEMAELSTFTAPKPS
jgi:hypothetical protein